MKKLRGWEGNREKGGNEVEAAKGQRKIGNKLFFRSLVMGHVLAVT
jgi:hypothetical protein